MQTREWTNRNKNHRLAALSIAPLQPISRSDTFFHRAQFRKCWLYVRRRLWVRAFLLQFSSCGRRSVRYSWLHRLSFSMCRQTIREGIKWNYSRCARYVCGVFSSTFCYCLTRDREHIRLGYDGAKLWRTEKGTWQLWNAICLWILISSCIVK